MCASDLLLLAVVSLIRKLYTVVYHAMRGTRFSICQISSLGLALLLCLAQQMLNTI